MKNKYPFVRIALSAAILLNLAVAAAAQKASSVEERNVRAQMNFLAGDALQGRGSGTAFERIAAEYVGSQFMQFGLEPAGEKDAMGNATYVQTVEVPGRPEMESLSVTGAGSPLVYGKDIAIFSIAAREAIAGPLQKIKPDGTAEKGAVVLLMPGENDKFESFQTKIGQLLTNGAAAVIITETAETRENWASVAGRKAMLSRRGNIFVLSKDASDAFSKLADGANIEIKGQFGAAASTYTWNAIGKLTGSDPNRSAEVILLSSHLDHLGVRESAPGDDKIFNGADDDASGTVAVLELARVLAAGKKPKRTVYFVCFGSEEAGGFGARYFVDNLPFPKENLVANLEFEMIGRPDAKVKADELWLTGYDRSNLGAELAKRGARLVNDPHPEQNFFQRSDNYTLARQGIIAHTVSSFGLHTDYHKASDEVKTIDFTHMTRSINSMVEPVRWLVDSDFKPAWYEGKKP